MPLKGTYNIKIIIEIAVKNCIQYKLMFKQVYSFNYCPKCVLLVSLQNQMQIKTVQNTKRELNSIKCVLKQ